jgi:hypothetical protein
MEQVLLLASYVNHEVNLKKGRIESGQTDYDLPAIAVGMQVHLLVLDRSPQPLYQDVILGRFWISRLNPRDNGSVIARHDWVHGRQAARLALRARLRLR